MTRYWLCPRGCGQRWPRVVQLCRTPDCDGKRPKHREPKHKAALLLPYEHFAAINGGDFCGICLARPKPGGRRLDRDHDHRTGQPRGLLCHTCNRMLSSRWTPERLRAAASYLDRTREEAA